MSMQLLEDVSGVPTAVEAVQRNMEVADPILAAAGKWYSGTEAERSTLVVAPERGKTFYQQTDSGTYGRGPYFYDGALWVPFGAQQDADGVWWVNVVARKDTDGKAEFGPVCVT